MNACYEVFLKMWNFLIWSQVVEHQDAPTGLLSIHWHLEDFNENLGRFFQACFSDLWVRCTPQMNVPGLVTNDKSTLAQVMA